MEAIEYGPTALEQRADVRSLDVLHQTRRQIMEKLAPLKALHGSNGCWDAKRKALVEALKVTHRLECRQREEKVTETYIDALAHADPKYQQFLDRMEEDKIAFLTLQTELDEVEEHIRSREIELLCYNSEAKLAR